AAAEQGSEDALLGRRHVGGRRIEYVLAHAVSPAPGAGSTCNRSTLWYGPPCQTVCRAGRQWSASPTGPGRLGCRSRWGKLLLVTWTRSRCPGAKRHAVSPSSRSASYGSSCGAPPAPSSRRLASATSSERPSGHTSVSLATTAVAGASEPKRSRSRCRPTTSSGSVSGSEVYRSTSGLLSRCAWLSGPAASRPSWSTRPPCEGTGSSGSSVNASRPTPPGGGADRSRPPFPSPSGPARYQEASTASGGGQLSARCQVSSPKRKYRTSPPAACPAPSPPVAVA